MKQLTDNPEENTQTSVLTDSRMHRKRRTDSPWLWVRLVGGSLVFHGALLAIALPLTARLSAASQAGSPTPVEFVELSEPSPEPTVTSQPPIESAAPSEPAPEPPVPKQPANETIPPSDIAFAPEPSPTISPSPIPSPEVSPSPESSPEPSPEISPSPEVQAETPFETAAVPPQPDSLPLPVPSASPAEPSPESPQPEPRASEPTPESATPETPDPEAPTPEPSAPEAPSGTNSDRPQPESLPANTTATATPPEPGLPASQPETLPSEPGLQTTPIDTPVPDVSGSIAAAPSTVNSDQLNSANSEAAAPVGVTLSLSGSSRVAPRGDEPVETLEVARPTNNSTSFLPDPSASACQVTPDVLNHAGTPIALQVTTDEQGKVMDVRTEKGSGSTDYDQLAACLVKEQWRFEPATVLNADRSRRQAIASDELLITLIINRN
jgi:TonB family protein